MSDNPNRLKDLVKLMAPFLGGAVASISPPAGRFGGAAADIYRTMKEQERRDTVTGQEWELRQKDQKLRQEAADRDQERHNIEKTRAEFAQAGADEYVKRLQDVTKKQQDAQTFPDSSDYWTSGPRGIEGRLQDLGDENMTREGQIAMARKGNVEGAAQLGETFRNRQEAGKQHEQEFKTRSDETAASREYTRAFAEQNYNLRKKGQEDLESNRGEGQADRDAGVSRKLAKDLIDAEAAVKSYEAELERKKSGGITYKPPPNPTSERDYLAAKAFLAANGPKQATNSKGLPAPAGLEPTGKFAVNKEGKRRQIYRDTTSGNFGFHPKDTEK